MSEKTKIVLEILSNKNDQVHATSITTVCSFTRIKESETESSLVCLATVLGLKFV